MSERTHTNPGYVVGDLEEQAMTDPAAARSLAAPRDEPLPRSDEYYLAMAALDLYPVPDDGLPKSTSVVFRIHQLGGELAALAAARLALQQQLAVSHDTLAEVNAVTSLDDKLQARVDAVLMECDNEVCGTFNQLEERAHQAEAALTQLRQQLEAAIREGMELRRDIVDYEAMDERFTQLRQDLRALPKHRVRCIHDEHGTVDDEWITARDLADRLARLPLSLTTENDDDENEKH